MKTTEKTDLSIRLKLLETKVLQEEHEGSSTLMSVSCFCLYPLIELHADYVCLINYTLVIVLNRRCLIFTCQGRPTQLALSHPEPNLQCLNLLLSLHMLP